jgi:FtsP/CotA-like multicopper oxidase with cupredoxin domain
VRVSIQNLLPGGPLVVHGLHSHPAAADDTVQVASGTTRELSFAAGAPGTYVYWGTTTGAALEERGGPDSQLNGAFVVDPAGGPPRRDHIFVITLLDLPPDTLAKRDERFTVAINGRAWPYTERFTFTVGDSVRWRWINASAEPHPMHLHGFYYRVESQGSGGADTAYAGDRRPLVVTRRIDPGQSISTRWSPTTPGNWLMHCHIVAHVMAPLVYPFSGHYEPSDSFEVVRGHDRMSGLVIGITAKPRPGTSAPTPRVRRSFRLVADSLPGGLGSRASIALSLAESGRPTVTSAPRVIGPTLILARGEPTRITLVNHLKAPFSIHWHGIELPSYYDGVAGWSGAPGHVAPHVMLNDSFVVVMAPPRAGTFIYHTHMENGSQLGDGLYGPLLVLPPGASYDSTTDLVQILGGNELGPMSIPWLNGEVSPPPLELEQAKTYRLRIINILADNALRVWLKDDRGPVTWRAVAKDGGDLPPAQQYEGPAFVRTNVGETYDFAFTPADTGQLRLEVGRPLLVSRAVYVRAAGAPRPTGPDAVVRQVDHLIVGTRDPAALFAFFTDSLGLPAASPLESYGEVQSGAVNLGNLNLELVKDATAQPGGARVLGLALEPYPIYQARQVLVARGLTLGRTDAVVQEGESGGKDTLGITVSLPDVSLGAAVFLCEYRSFDVAARHAALRDSLAARQGGALGLQGVWEIRVGATDSAEVTGRWRRLLAPFAVPASGPWPLGTGPRLAIDAAASDGVHAIVLRAASLKAATETLRKRGWLAPGSDAAVRLDPARVDGLDVRVVEPEP